MKALLKKIHAIMVDVPYIQKDATNPHQNYTYASERVIKTKMREAFVKHGVLFKLDGGEVYAVNDKFSCQKFSYTFADVESGETWTGTFNGFGHLRDDKAGYAAITGAIKYILTSNFLIPTGDDPEAEDAPVEAEAAPVFDRQKAIIRIYAGERKCYPADIAVTNARKKYLDPAMDVSLRLEDFPSIPDGRIQAYLDHMIKKARKIKEKEQAG